MGFSWKKAAEGEFEKMPEGYHYAKVVKLRHTDKDGRQLTNKNDDPYMMAVFANREGEEATCNFTLTQGKGAWALALLLAAAKVDLDQFERDGHTPEDFQDEKFANDTLVGKYVWIQVAHNGKYVNADPVQEADVPPHELKRARGGEAAKPEPVVTAPEGDDDPIPF